MEYHTERSNLMYCYICGRTNHNHGFVGVLQDQTAILIGNCCADDLVNQSTLRQAKRTFATRKASVHYEGRSASIVRMLPTLAHVASTYDKVCGELDDRLHRITQKCPDEISQIAANAKLNGARLMSSEWVPNPLFRHQVRVPKLISVSKNVGMLAGTKFLLSGRRLEALLYGITRSIDSLERVTSEAYGSKPDPEILVRRFRSEIQEASEELDELLPSAVNLLSKQNLLLVDLWVQYEEAAAHEATMSGRRHTFFQAVIDRATANSITIPLPSLSQAILKGFTEAVS
jgi:hypothetical protein